MATQASCAASPEVENGVNSANPLKTLPTKPKKRLVRRVQRDRSAIYRRTFQAAFLLLNLWIGVRFYSWVRHFELGLRPSQVGLPAGVEGWLPICWADEPEILAAERADSAGASGGDVSRTEAIATMLRSGTAIIGMKTFHCQRIPVAHRTMGGRFMGVSHQRRGWGAREDVAKFFGVNRQVARCGEGGHQAGAYRHRAQFSSTIGAHD